ncbi:hypothetical protein LO80_02525 [Candidatus Francisella endociliophora]|uniref:Uncharacterized protein n=1 Tax=Candidatus Francisella endociliophora TaxID=653937 RepID=A0A097EN27_9GAMM|nr:hypothetical protein [Francisella sp. FSC1006]AIT08967.1 hypothetical protein LO80_02525 [Francisella sp. FSC1006]
MNCKDLLYIFNNLGCDYNIYDVYQLLVKKLSDYLPVYIDLYGSINNSRLYFISDIDNYENVEQLTSSNLHGADYVRIYSVRYDHFGYSMQINIIGLSINNKSYKVSSTKNKEMEDYQDGIKEIVSENNKAFTFYITSEDFIEHFGDILDLEPYIAKKDNQPKSTTNQDDNYKYSEALNPYNDIILAFQARYDYLTKRLNKKPILKSDIQDWLDNEKLYSQDLRVIEDDDTNIRESLKSNNNTLKWYQDNYTINKKTKTYHLSRDKSRVLKELIASHYEI